jgi:hypothetical protein
VTERTAYIDTVLAELRRVWTRNPHKTLAQVVARATRGGTSFLPTDAADVDVLAELRKIGAGQPAPDELASQLTRERVHR